MYNLVSAFAKTARLSPATREIAERVSERARVWLLCLFVWNFLFGLSPLLYFILSSTESVHTTVGILTLLSFASLLLSITSRLSFSLLWPTH